MKYKVYQISLCDEATLMCAFEDEDRAKQFRNLMYICDERSRAGGEPIEMFRYVIIYD